MWKPDRRTFLKNMAQGSLAASLRFAVPAIAWNDLAHAQGISDQNPPIPRMKPLCIRSRRAMAEDRRPKCLF